MVATLSVVTSDLLNQHTILLNFYTFHAILQYISSILSIKCPIIKIASITINSAKNLLIYYTRRPGFWLYWLPMFQNAANKPISDDLPIKLCITVCYV